MPGEPAAFMSYASFNDVHDNGQLTAFRKQLAAEVQVQTGHEFVIFQDRTDIAWGQNSRARIEETLDVVRLLVPVITPGFFRSAACRREVSRFLERERQLGRQDLILPVYYVSAQEIDDPSIGDLDEIARVLKSRQFVDWRELRFEPFTSPVVRRSVAKLAARMRDTFWHLGQPHPQPGAQDGQPGAQDGQPGALGGLPAQAPGESAGLIRAASRVTPPTRVVDVWGHGDYATVGAAVAAAKAGDRILVRPGSYTEALVVDKPLEIMGDGPLGGIELCARGAEVLVFKANIGLVANLTLRQTGGTGDWYAVNITQGRLDLEDCDISSQSLSCVAISNGADPRLRRNHIHDSGEAGVYVFDDGLGTLEENDITGNTNAGVMITTGGNPTLRGNRINRNRVAAVRVLAGGRGVLEGNDLTGNAGGAWDIADDCAPYLLRARNKE
jgi:F-box protein 11